LIVVVSRLTDCKWRRSWKPIAAGLGSHQHVVGTAWGLPCVKK
jgi:hypothetical protein